MRVYTSHLRQGRVPHLEREGFAWGAALFGPVWLAWRGAWIPAAVLLALVILLGVAIPAPFREPYHAALFSLQGLFGRDLVRWTFGLRGWLPGPVVAARGIDEALARLLASGKPGLLEGVSLAAV